MSNEPSAVDGAPPAAPADPAIEAIEQENPAPPANADSQDESPDDKPRDEKGRFVQDRINELTKARRQAERERDAYAAQLQQVQSQQHQPASQDKPPSFEDYPDLNQWAAAVADHARKSATEEASRHFSERQQQTSQEQVFSEYGKREREYATAHPDYPDALEALQSSVRFNPAVLEVLATSEHGPAIVHHLGQHLDTADSLSRMSPHRAAYEIARLEAQVTAPKPKPVTKAPNPAPTLGGGAVASKDPDRMTPDEWLAWRNSEIKKR